MVNIIFASLVAVVAAAPVKLTWFDAGSAKSHGKIHDLTPLTIEVPGASTLVGSGVLDSRQTSVSFKFSAKKLGIDFVSGMIKDKTDAISLLTLN